MEVVMVYLWLNDVEFRYITVAAYGQIGRYLLNSRYSNLKMLKYGSSQDDSKYVSTCTILHDIRAANGRFKSFLVMLRTSYEKAPKTSSLVVARQRQLENTQYIFEP